MHNRRKKNININKTVLVTGIDWLMKDFDTIYSGTPLIRNMSNTFHSIILFKLSGPDRLQLKISTAVCFWNMFSINHTLHYCVSKWNFVSLSRFAENNFKIIVLPCISSLSTCLIVMIPFRTINWCQISEMLWRLLKQ